jgi:hypothetical protein
MSSLALAYTVRKQAHTNTLFLNGTGVRESNQKLQAALRFKQSIWPKLHFAESEPQKGLRKFGQYMAMIQKILKLASSVLVLQQVSLPRTI